MAAKKRVDPIKQREKRAKIGAVIGVVLLIAVGAYEIPSMLAVMNKKPPAGAAVSDAGNRNPDGSIPLPNVSSSPGLASNGGLSDTDVPPSAQEAQLVSFSVFETKNPFKPQVTDSSVTVDTPSGPSSTAPAATSTTTTPATTMTIAPTPPATGSAIPPTATPPSTTPPSTTPPTTATPSSTPSAPVTPTVAVKVNGKVSRVGSQGTFPDGSPVFRLVSWTKDTAQVGIVGGSYATGDATLTLHVGKRVTLENTTSGKTYQLELISTP